MLTRDKRGRAAHVPLVLSIPKATFYEWPLLFTCKDSFDYTKKLSCDT